ncbi:MAG TPA: sugar ABC transporter permease [Clostridiales bacterium]|nr:sugar ABC transporter permease [Clostridiales bacterium]
MPHKKNKWRRYIPLYMMMLPGTIYLIINNYIPMGGLVLAFKKFNYSLGMIKSPWNGLSNFKFLFIGADAWKMIRNTLGYNFVFIVLGTTLAIIVAILLNEVAGRKARKLYQTIILVPYLISTVIVSYIVYAFLSQDNGFINHTLLRGENAISWYTSPKYWPFILTFVQLWKSFGYSSIIYFATIIGIDPTYYEAASIDGAGKLKQVVSITLPCLKPTIITLTLLSIGRVFYSDFGLFYQIPMGAGTLLDVTQTIDTYVYRALLVSNDVGRAAAAGFLQSLLGFILVYGANLMVNKIDKENALF